jgi:hypothetical protein
VVSYKEADLFNVNSSGSAGETQFVSLGALKFWLYGTNSDVIQSSTMAISANDWHCLEWQTVGGETRSWLDGTEAIDLHVTGLVQFPLVSFDVGFEVWTTGAQPASEAWIDDVRVNGSRIGCAP